MTSKVVTLVTESYVAAYARGVQELLRECGWQPAAIPSVAVLHEAAMAGCAFVAVVHGKVVGFIRVVSDKEVVSYITELVVAPDERLHGLGRALVEQVANRFPRARIDLLATHMAQPFYEQTGFTSRQGYRRWP